MNHDPDSENVTRLQTWKPADERRVPTVKRCLWTFTLLMNLHDRLLTEHVITAAPVLTMSETRFLSDSVVNMWLQKGHVSGSVISFATEHLLEPCGSGRVSRGKNSGMCTICSYQWRICDDQSSICSCQWTTETDGERCVWNNSGCAIVEFHEFA